MERRDGVSETAVCADVGFHADWLRTASCRRMMIGTWQITAAFKAFNRSARVGVYRIVFRVCTEMERALPIDALSRAAFGLGDYARYDMTMAMHIVTRDDACCVLRDACRVSCLFVRCVKCWQPAHLLPHTSGIWQPPSLD
jgi:hypothetical protein